MENKKEFIIRTDLALEKSEIVKEQKGTLGDGVETIEEEKGTCKITTVNILNEKGSEMLGRPCGTYITIESEFLNKNDASCHEEAAKCTAQCLNRIEKFKNAKSILVVGLGNWNITPDALGPKVVERMLVTRHIMDTVPDELKNGGVRPLAALSPGVMGITGIETFEIIKGVTEKTKPDVIVAVDALAARSVKRINQTIQISDTGVAPGAGVGNKRAELSEKTLGVPVIAIGVPTVVDAATMAGDTIDRIIHEMKVSSEKGSEFYAMLDDLSHEEKYSLIYEILQPYEENMFVTPKDVDFVIDNLSEIIANAVNIASHPGFTIEDIKKYCI